MSSLKAIISDVEGNYNSLRNIANNFPYLKDGLDMFLLGDSNGPKDKQLFRSQWHPEKYYQNLYDFPQKGEKEKNEAERVGLTAYNETKNLIDVLENHPKIGNVDAISGNGEEDYQKFITYFADVENPRDLLAKSSLNFIEMPEVHFYKDGKKVENKDNVDTAILLLPYIQLKGYYNKIQKIFGEELSEKDFVKQALKELLESNGLIDKIKKANPKYILQMQHEAPVKEIFEPYGKAYEPQNKEVYEAVMEALSEYVEGTGKKYTIIFGHIEKGGRFKQIITYKGRNIKTIHVDEHGRDVLYVDVKTGRIYEKGEALEVDSDEELSEATIEDIINEAEPEGEPAEAEAIEAE